MAALENDWKTLSLTHVIYPKGDLYGKFLGIFSLLPHCLVISFFTLTVFVRDIHVISFFAGQLINELLNTILKRNAAEGRPEQIPGKANVNNSFGWPSSHCQFQAFFFVYATLCIVIRLRKTRNVYLCVLLLVANIFSLVFIVHSRTYLRYHFTHQCVHGLMIGASFAIFWFLFINFLVEPFIWEPLLQSKLNNLLQLCSIYLPNRELKKLAKTTSSFRNNKLKSK